MDRYDKIDSDRRIAALEHTVGNLESKINALNRRLERAEDRLGRLDRLERTK